MVARWLVIAGILVLVAGGLWYRWKPSEPIADHVAQPAVESSPAPQPISIPPESSPPKPAEISPVREKPVIAVKKNPAPASVHRAAAVPSVPIPPTVSPVRPPPPAPPPQEWRGNNDTAIKHSGQFVVLTERGWIKFWAEHHPGEVSPDVDFSKNMVVGVFLGQRPADQFSVEITGTRLLSNAFMVDYAERVPPPGTFQVAVEVYPYTVKVVPQSKLPVKFNKLPSQYLPDTSVIRSTSTHP